MRRILAAAMLLSALLLVPAASAQDIVNGNCVGRPGEVQACAGPQGDGVCAGVGLGYQGTGACVYDDHVRVCVGFNCEDIRIR